MNPAARISANRRLLAVCLFLLVLGSRWTAVDRIDTDLPVWDQWDAEGLFVLAPWLQHRLRPEDFLRPHNEHRVVLTKLLNFALTAANGQWDQRLEAAVNAILPGLVAVALFIFGCRHFERRWHGPLFLLLTAAYALPVSWQNVLGGFHSQQFFLIGLSLGAIGWLALAPPWSWSWWLGAACVILDLGSMATGFFAAVVVAGLVGVRLIRRRTTLRAAWPALALCSLLIAVGCATRVSAPYHDFLKARGPQDFLTSVVRSLQWPGSWTAWAAVVIWMPWCWLTWRVFTDANDESGAGWILAGLGGWVITQILAAGYARSAGGAPPAARYLDTLLLGVVANGMAIGWLWPRPLPSRRQRILLAMVVSAWVPLMGAGIAAAVAEVLEIEFPAQKAYLTFCEQNVRNYLATGDESFLHHPEIPYPGAGSLIGRLQIPELRALLPASVRSPLPLEPAASGAFVRYDTRSSLSSSTGLSPATPPLANRATWGSFGTASPAGGAWISTPLRLSHSGWLKFEVAGDLGEPGLALEVRDAATGRMLSSVRPAAPPGHSWRSVTVPAPAGSFIVEARAGKPGRWFAFSQPVEVGPLSFWAHEAVKAGCWVVGAGVLGALVLGAAAWRTERRR